MLSCRLFYTSSIVVRVGSLERRRKGLVSAIHMTVLKHLPSNMKGYYQSAICQHERDQN